MTTPSTAYIYIDGFNLYYGAVKGTPHKLLDLEALCRHLLPNDNVAKIRYFTARVSARPTDPSIHQRQDTYLRALRTLPTVEIHEGRFLTSYPRMALRTPPAGGPNTVEVIKSEEKGSDVNLASHLLLDGFRKAYDVAVVVTNDSDLAEPIRIVRQELGLPVGIINPQRSAKRSRALLDVTFFKQLRTSALPQAQMPNPVIDAAGRAIHKPPRW